MTLANTQRTIFRDGFSAIAPLDTNRDGRIDATDGAVSGWSIRRDLDGDGVIGASETRLAQASDLRIWRDLNVSGRIDAGELMSFAEANVVSINVNRAWQGRTALGNGNELIATGSYTRSDNTTRGTGALNLGVHSFDRSFIAPQDVAPSATGLPALNGSGAVADLQVAASSSGTLASVLSTYAAQTTRTGQLALLDGLIGEWAATSSMKSGREQGVDRQVIVEYRVWGLTTTTILALVGTALNNSSASGQLPVSWGQFELAQTPQWREWVRRMEVIEKFNGSTLVDFDALQVQTQTRSRTLGIDPQTQQPSLVTASWRQAQVAFDEQRNRLVEAAYVSLRESVYGQLALQTRLKPYLDEIVLVPQTSGVSFDFSGLNQRLQTLRNTDPAAALIDAIELVRYAGKQLHPMGWEGVALAAQWVTEARANPAMASVLAEMRVRGMDWANNADLSSWFQSTHATNVIADMVWGSENPDVIYGGDGVDAALGGGGDDLILGGPGNDGSLDGNDGNDIIDSGAGDDY
ncbi:MAG: hypothetical protein ACK5X5_16090, partial [bacterium]